MTKEEPRKYAESREEYFREFHSVIAPVVVLDGYDYERKYAKNREEYFREFHRVIAPVVVMKVEGKDE